MNRNLLGKTALPLPHKRQPGLWGILARLGQTAFALLFACALFLGLVQNKASAALVSYDGTNVSWSVSDLLTPLTTAVIAAVGAAVVIFTIWVGVRWIFRMVKGSK